MLWGYKIRYCDVCPRFRDECGTLVSIVMHCMFLITDYVMTLYELYSSMRCYKSSLHNSVCTGCVQIKYVPPAKLLVSHFS